MTSSTALFNCPTSCNERQAQSNAACRGTAWVSSSPPCLVKITRRSVTWHAEQINVWYSKPRTVAVSSGTTFVRINSAPQAVQRILAHVITRSAHPARGVYDLAYLSCGRTVWWLWKFADILDRPGR